MPNPASDAARNPAPHDTPTRTTPDTATSITHATNSDPSTNDQVDTPTTPTPNRTDDRTDQGQNQEQSTNRAGIRMPRLAAGQRQQAESPLSQTTKNTTRAAVIGGRDAA
jgi:hypothetical protein